MVMFVVLSLWMELSDAQYERIAPHLPRFEKLDGVFVGFILFALIVDVLR